MARSLHLKRNNNPRPANAQNVHTCYMSSVQQGGNLRYNFDPDPTQILWSMTAQTQTKQTRGGQVAYSTGRTIGPLQIVGYCRSRWDLKELGDFVGLHMSEAVKRGAPLRFVYPQRDVDYLIYIDSLSDIGYDGESGEICAYALTCTITQDHSSLSTVKRSILIDNPLLSGIEWIDAKRAYEIAEQRFGGIIGSADSGGGGGGGSGGDDGGGSGGGDGGKSGGGGDDGRTQVSDDLNERLPGPGEQYPSTEPTLRPGDRDGNNGVVTWRDRNNASPWEIARRSLNPFNENPFR